MVYCGKDDDNIVEFLIKSSYSSVDIRAQSHISAITFPLRWKFTNGSIQEQTRFLDKGLMASCRRFCAHQVSALRIISRVAEF
jgi:hypothetical protein